MERNDAPARTPAEAAATPLSPTGVAVGMVGTYPPTRCGIATFTQSLTRAMGSTRAGCRVEIVSSVEEAGATDHPPEVVAEVVRGSRASRVASALLLDRCDVVVVQHEFGIYGGDDGAEVLDLVNRVESPVVVVLHTVVRRPTAGQRAVVEELADRAAAVVVQSEAARERLLRAHAVSPERVRLIPHGARPNLSTSPAIGRVGASPLVLTWGLIGPGKGIELGIEAMALLGDLHPRPRYLVVGQTHPRVRQWQGERYRESLVRLARERGVEHLVTFDDRYPDTERILAQVREADIVLLPYRSREQVVSGVLVEAIASTTPVIATAFPHASELLGTGAGIVVPHDDAGAIAAAIRALCTDPAATARLVAAARHEAPKLFWTSVASAYRGLALAVAEPSLEMAV